MILTGEAIKRKNARAIDELFADEAGKFVCATAGHNARMPRSRRTARARWRCRKARDACILHVDIGGGTTKLALIDHGRDRRARRPSRSAAGCRATDESGAWTRIDRFGAARRRGSRHRAVAADARRSRGPRRRSPSVWPPSRPITFSTRRSIRSGKRCSSPSRCRARPKPTAITFSGGVAEYMFGHEPQEFGDIAKLLAGELAQRAEPARQLAADRSRPAHPRHRHRRLAVHRPGQRQDDLSARSVRAAGAQCAGRACRRRTRRRYRSERGLPPRSARPRRTRPRAAMRALAIAFAWHGDPELSRGSRPPARAIVQRACAGRQAQRAAAADDRRRRRQDVRPHPASTNCTRRASSCRSTACSCRSSTMSMSAN